jgi:hypothetical protein
MLDAWLVKLNGFAAQDGLSCPGVPVTLEMVIVQFATPALSDTPVSAIVLGAVKLAVPLQPAENEALAPGLSLSALGRVSVKLMPVWAGDPALLARLNLRVVFPVTSIEDAAKALVRIGCGGGGGATETTTH